VGESIDSLLDHLILGRAYHTLIFLHRFLIACITRCNKDVIIYERVGCTFLCSYVWFQCDHKNWSNVCVNIR